jgi:DNA-binding response OmpR family regulator
MVARNIAILSDNDLIEELLGQYDNALVLERVNHLEQIPNSSQALIVDTNQEIIPQSVEIPTIVIVTRNENINNQHVIQGKAVHYLLKPIRLLYLLNLLESIFTTTNNLLTLNEHYLLNQEGKTLICEGKQPIELTEKEVSLLHYLYNASNKEASKEELLYDVWGYNAKLDTHTVETHIYRLRQKLDCMPSLIMTTKLGYRLGTVKE